MWQLSSSKGPYRFWPDVLRLSAPMLTSGSNPADVKEAGRWELLFMGKRLLCALFLDTLKSGSFNPVTGQGNDRCSWDVFIDYPRGCHTLPYIFNKVCWQMEVITYNHIGVGFCALLVLDWMGTCQSPRVWNE